MRSYWVSHPKFTGQVQTDDSGRIVLTPNVWYRFKGQPFDNLKRWLSSLGPGLKIEELK